MAEPYEDELESLFPDRDEFILPETERTYQLKQRGWIFDSSEDRPQRKPNIKLDYSPKEAQPLYQQFNSPENSRAFGRKGTVSMQVDNFEDKGSGRLVLMDRTNAGSGLYFYPDDVEFDKAAAKSAKGWATFFESPAYLAPLVPIAGGARNMGRMRNFKRTGTYYEGTRQRWPFKNEDLASQSWNVKPLTNNQANSVIQSAFTPKRTQLESTVRSHQNLSEYQAASMASQFMKQAIQSRGLNPNVDVRNQANVNGFSSPQDLADYLEGRQRFELADEDYIRRITNYETKMSRTELSSGEMQKYKRLKAGYTMFRDAVEVARSHGDDEIDAYRFLKSERRYENNLKRAVSYLNLAYDTTYKAAIEARLTQLEKLDFLTPEAVNDIRALAAELEKKPQTVQSLGHTESLKAIFDKGERDGDRSSNIDLEMMLNFFEYDDDGQPTILHPGNRQRGAHDDKDPYTRRLLQGQNVDLEEEYLFDRKPELFTRMTVNAEGKEIPEVVPVQWQGKAMREYNAIMEEARAYLLQNPNTGLTLQNISRAVTVAIRDFYGTHHEYFDSLKDDYSQSVFEFNTKADNQMAQAFMKALEQALIDVGINPAY